MNKSLNLQVLAVSFGKILSMLASFLVPVILVRFLTKDDYGVYNQFNVVFLFVTALFSLGFRSNLFYFYPNSNNEKKATVLLQTVLVLFVLGVLASLLILISDVNHILIGEGPLQNYTGFIAFAIILQMLSSITDTLYVLRRDLRLSMIYPFMNIFIKVTIVVSFVFIFNTLEAVLYGVNIFLFISAVFATLYIIYELNKINAPLKFSLSIFKEQFKYSLPFGISTSIKAILTKVDKILAITYLSTTAYASYSIAFISIPGIQAIYDSLVQVYIIDMTKALKEHNYKKAIDIYQDLVSKSLSYTIPLVLLVFYYADIIIPFLFTDKYEDSVNLFRIFMFSVLFMVMGTGLVIRASGKTKHTLTAYMLSAIISLPTTFYLISNFGAYGAVVSALIAVVLPTIFLIYFDIKILNSNLKEFIPWKKIGGIVTITFFSFIPIYICHLFFVKNILFMIINSIIYLILIVGLEYRYGLLVVEKETIDQFLVKFK